MAKNEFEKLQELTKEIAWLKKEIEQLSFFSCAAESSNDSPRIDILESQLAHKEAKLCTETERFEEWLDTLDDAESRLIMRLRYRGSRKRTWKEIAEEVHYHPSTVKRKHDDMMTKYFAAKREADTPADAANKLISSD